MHTNTTYKKKRTHVYTKDLQIREFSEIFESECNNLQDGFEAVDYKIRQQPLLYTMHT